MHAYQDAIGGDWRSTVNCIFFAENLPFCPLFSILLIEQFISQ